MAGDPNHWTIHWDDTPNWEPILQVKDKVMVYIKFW